ncbi:prepilin-type N-terminal cleavage/methylation domain-containing protein [Oceanicoccus sp. KOV_DT_Chl]|uniref:prepilin-type N-terminal cleavage/methylation domain-containing protein n=1 Tax=Oceanicoccus sp. KOV_DT_Chl TaxID=1904639 RepID=UPI000C7A528C|nr:prepilin-type N-terminal cleavage/methylation domain-containing protein [Oceanicoccus sp. KOV_DT_Chl]
MRNQLVLSKQTFRGKRRGFSLVELLVVLLIIGLGFSLVSVNVGSSDGQQLQVEARQFANNTSLIAEEAVLSNRQWGVDIYRQLEEGIEQLGYRWLIRNDDGDWQLAVDSHRPVDFVFSPFIGLRISLEGADQPIEIPNKRDIETIKPMLQAQPKDEERPSVVEQLEQGNQREPIEPALWLLSSGEMSAFSMELYIIDDPDNKVTVVGDELGRIALKLPGDNDDE